MLSVTSTIAYATIFGALFDIAQGARPSSWAAAW